MQSEALQEIEVVPERGPGRPAIITLAVIEQVARLIASPPNNAFMFMPCVVRGLNGFLWQKHALAETETFYNQERPHQGLGNKIIQVEFNRPSTDGTIVCNSRLGGMLNYYYREAASLRH